MVLPGEGGKDGFHGSSKLSNTMPPPPPPPKENFESCTVAYCCHKKAMAGMVKGAGKLLVLGFAGSGVDSLPVTSI